MLGLLEQDRWFGFRCGSFSVFFLSWVKRVCPTVGHQGTHGMPAGGCSPALVVALRRWWLGLGFAGEGRWFGLGVGLFWSFSSSFYFFLIFFIIIIFYHFDLLHFFSL